MSVPPIYFFMVSAALFSVGMLGVLIRRNIIVILLAVEIMLNAANLSFVAFSRMHGDMTGQVVSLFVIAVAASEIAVGLAIVVLLFRREGFLDPGKMGLMKW